MTCKCAEKVNKMLKEKNECLGEAFDTKGNVYYIVKVDKILGGNFKSKVTLLLANYCPFCGKKQEKK